MILAICMLRLNLCDIWSCDWLTCRRWHVDVGALLQGLSIGYPAHYKFHSDDVRMGVMASQITSLVIVYSTVYSRRRSITTSKLRVTGFVRGIHRWPVNSPHKGPVTRKMFPFARVTHWLSCALQVFFVSFARAKAGTDSNAVQDSFTFGLTTCI